MPQKTGASVDRARRELLEKGCASYPDAMVALAHFRRFIFDLCNKVAERRLPHIRRVLGIAVSGADVGDSADEVDDFYDGATTFLGAEVTVEGQCSFYVGLDWRDHEGSQTLRLHASVFPWRKTGHTRLAKALQARYRETVVVLEEGDTHWCGVEESPGPAFAKRLGDRLGHLADSLLDKLEAVNARKLLRA